VLYIASMNAETSRTKRIGVFIDPYHAQDRSAA